MRPEDEGHERPRSHLVVGHVCLDLVPGSEPELGGTSFFAGVQAAALGAEVTVLTACSRRTAGVLRSRLPSSVAICRQPTECDTRFEFSPSGPSRLMSYAGTLQPTRLGRFRSAHLGPIAGEISAELVSQVHERADFVGLTPQGFMRRVADDGRISLRDITPYELAKSADAVVVNDSEAAVLSTSSTFLEDFDGPVFITQGQHGAHVMLHGKEVARAESKLSAQARLPEDTIGAGDVFASTAFVLLAQGVDLREALATSVDAATKFVYGRNAA